MKLRSSRSVGFSMGVGIALGFLRHATWAKGAKVELLALGPNLNKNTCFISVESADMDALSPIEIVISIAEGRRKPEATEEEPPSGADQDCGSIEVGLRRWLAIHEYVVEAFKRFHNVQNDLVSLKDLANEIGNRSLRSARTAFRGNYEAVTGRERRLACILSGNKEHRQIDDAYVLSVGRVKGGHFALIEDAVRR